MLKDLWGEVLREEQQRHDLMLMFPDLQLSPGTAEPDRARFEILAENWRYFGDVFADFGHT